MPLNNLELIYTLYAHIRQCSSAKDLKAPLSFANQLKCSLVNVTLMVIKDAIGQSAWDQISVLSMALSK